MPIYSSNNTKLVENIVLEQLEDATDTTISGNLSCGTLTTSSTAGFSALTTHNLGIKVGTTADAGQQIQFFGSSGGQPSLVNNIGDLTIKTSTVSKTVILSTGSGANKLTIGNTNGCILTNSSLTIPNGTGNTTGSIIIKGNSADSTIFTTAAGNTLNVSSGGAVVVNAATSATISLQQNAATMLSITSGGDTAVAKNLTLSNVSGDKTLTFTNVGGSNTIVSTNTTGDMTYNVQSGAAHSFAVNGVEQLNISGALFYIPNSLQVNGNQNNYGDTWFNGSLNVANAFRMNYSTVNANYTITNQDKIIVCTTTAGTRTLTLPNSNSFGFPGNVLKIKRVGANTCTVAPGASCTIDGSASSIVLSTNYQVLTLYAEGTNAWYTM